MRHRFASWSYVLHYYCTLLKKKKYVKLYFYLLRCKYKRYFINRRDILFVRNLFSKSHYLSDLKLRRNLLVLMHFVYVRDDIISGFCIISFLFMPVSSHFMYSFIQIYFHVLLVIFHYELNIFFFTLHYMCNAFVFRREFIR